MKKINSKLAATFCVSFVLFLAACTAPTEQNLQDNTQSQTQENPEQNNQQQSQGGMENENVEGKTPKNQEENEITIWNLEGEINTSDWTTFTNLKHGYSFKYPSDKMEIIKENPEISLEKQDIIRFSTNPQIKLNDCQNYLFDMYGLIKASNNPNQLTPKEFFENKIGHHKWIFYDKETTINNKEAYLVAFTFLDTYPNFTLYLKKSENTILYMSTGGLDLYECGYDFKSEMTEESEYFPHNFIKLGEAIFNTVHIL